MTKANKKRQHKGSKLKLQFEVLNLWNIIIAVLLFAEAIVLIVLANSQSFPITTSFLTIDNLTSTAAGHTVLAPATRHLLDINIVYLITGYLLIASALHTLKATFWRKKYENDLKKGVNRLRWLEYILAGGLVVLTVSLLNGIYDISTLLAIFALTEILALFALLVEAHKEISKNHPRVVNKIALVAWVTPWLILAAYLFGAQVYGHSLAAYIYWIDATVFLLFLAKPINMYMTNHKRGRWANYIYGEGMYMALGFIVKTALTWQIFFGLLR